MDPARFLIALLVGALALAGCVGEEDAPEEAVDGGTSDRVPPDSPSDTDQLPSVADEDVEDEPEDFYESGEG